MLDAYRSPDLMPMLRAVRVAMGQVFACCRSKGDGFDVKVQGLACQRVVEIEQHAVGTNISHF
jgi:hypothetical protein